MAILSSIFGGNDSSSSNDTFLGSDSVLEASNVLGLDFVSSQQNYSEDEDGNVSWSTNDNSLGLDLDTDSLLGNMTDFFNSSDQMTN